MISEIFRHVVTHLGTRLFEGRLKKDALTPALRDDGQDIWRLAFSRWNRIVWSVMTLVWSVGVALFLWLSTEGDLKWPLYVTGPMFVGLLAFSAVTAWDAFTQQVEVSAWGFSERRAGAVVSAFPWTDVTRIEFLIHLDSYRVIPLQGKPVRISMHIRGIPRFKELAGLHAPAGALDTVRVRMSNLDQP